MQGLTYVSVLSLLALRLRASREREVTVRQEESVEHLRAEVRELKEQGARALQVAGGASGPPSPGAVLELFARGVLKKEDNPGLFALALVWEERERRLGEYEAARSLVQVTSPRPQVRHYVAILFAAASFIIGGLVPWLRVSQVLLTQDHDNYYAVLGILSCAMAAAAYALGGSESQDEAQLIEAMKNVAAIAKEAAALSAIGAKALGGSDDGGE